MSSTPACSVVIPSWNGRPLLEPCLEALRRQTWTDFETIVVDNASTDGSAQWVSAHHPQVRLLVQERNRGFAGGCNAGIAAAQAPLLVLLNNDTVAEPHFLERLLEPALQDGAVGMVAGVLLFAHRPERVASAGIAMHRDGVALDHLATERREDLPTTWVELFGPSGGAALYRRSMLDQVGLFRESYFAYLEDVDLAWRGRLRGWRCLLAPGAVVHHLYSATAGHRSSFKSYHLARNRLLVLFLNLPAGLWFRFAAYILAYDAAACSYGVLTRDWALLRGRLAALRQLPALWPQRRAVQRGRQVSLSSLARLMAPPLTPWATMRLRREIAALATPSKA